MRKKVDATVQPSIMSGHYSKACKETEKPGLELVESRKHLVRDHRSQRENAGYSPARGLAYRFSSQTVILSCSKLALYAVSMLSNNASKSSRAQRSAVNDDKLSGSEMENC
jgi:hypothetical protein